MKLEDFLVMIGLKLLVKGYLENTVRYTTPFKNSENSVMTQALIYLSAQFNPLLSPKTTIRLPPSARRRNGNHERNSVMRPTTFIPAYNRLFAKILTGLFHFITNFFNVIKGICLPFWHLLVCCKKKKRFNRLIHY